MKSFFQIAFCTFFMSLVFHIHSVAQGPSGLLREGNKQYHNDDYTLAEEKYRKSLEIKNRAKTNYNLGNSLYKQGRYEEAIEAYQKASSGEAEPNEEAKVYHNLGNAYFNANQLDEAIKAYKQAIRLNPEDDTTKHNLMASQVMKQMQQQQQQQDQQSQESQDQQENQDQQQNQENKENQDSQQEEQENSENQDSEQEESQMQEGGMFDSTRLDKQELDSLDAVKLLQIVESEEQKVQEKLRKFNSDRKKQDKDW